MDGSEQFEYVHMRYIQMRLELGKEDDWETCGRDVKMHSMTDPTARIFFAVMKTGWTNSCHGASTSTSKEVIIEVKQEIVSDQEDEMLCDIGRVKHRPKRPADEALVPIADAEDGEEAMPKHRNLSKAQLEKQLTQQGVERAKAAGISFSQEFQKMHHSCKDHIPPGHWSRFALQVAKAERIKCEMMLTPPSRMLRIWLRQRPNDRKGETEKRSIAFELPSPADPERRDCPGILLGQGRSSIDNLEASCVRWVKKGMIQTKAAAQDDTRSCVVTWDGEMLILKHKQCCNAARSGGLACIWCQRLADSKAFRKEVAVWSLRIQFAADLHTLVYGTDEEQASFEEELLTDEASPLCSGEVATVLAVQTKAGRVAYLKRLLQAVSLAQRTERLYEFVQAAVVGLHFRDDSNDERTAFQALISRFASKVLDGTVSRDTLESLELASKVASGALSGHKVVNCLIQSFSSNRSKETTNLLGLFGVTNRMDLLMPGVPQCWLAHAEPDLLVANARTILETLSIAATKPRTYFLAIDAGQCCVVGGQWSKVASENFALLKAGDDLPPDRLSSLTVHVVASRVESNSSLWCVAAVPMPSGSTGKGMFFLELMGQIAECFVQENEGYAPTAFACDAGTSNMLLMRTSLGLAPPEAASAVPFFRHCSYEAVGFRYIKKMLYRGKQVVHCTLDTLHLLKRLAFHTGSGQRSVRFGAIVVDCAAMLRGGIPLKSFVGTDGQSDRQALDRLNPAYCHRGWQGFGMAALQMLSGLISSASEGSHGLGPETRVTNAAMAYFLLLLGLAQSKWTWTHNWGLHFLPIVTVRNICWSLVQAILVAIHSPGADASKLQEKIAESWFGRAKADLASPEITCARAAVLVDKAFKAAVNLMQHLSYKVTGEEIEKNFKAWWRSEGHDIMTQGGGGPHDPEDGDDDAAGIGSLDALLEDAAEIDYEDVDPAAAARQDDLRRITAAEDHAAVKAELAALHEELVQPPSAAPEVPVDAGAQVVQHEDTEAFDMTTVDAWTADKTLQRHLSPMSAMRQFSSSIRQREGIGSRAATLLHGGRQSRSTAWMAVQNKAEETADAEQLAFRPDYLRPDSGKHEPQVIVYLDAQKNVRVGMVASIWRGAVVKPDGSASRQMRTTRASPGVPPVLFAEPCKLFCCCLSEISLIDPLDSVLCELKVQSIVHLDTKCVVRMPAGFDEVLQEISASPEQWKAKSSAAQQIPDGPDEVATEAKVWVASMFTWSLAAGLAILDEEGCVALGGGTSILWDCVAKMASEYFDVSFSTVVGKNYGKAVLAELSEVFPRNHQSVEKLQKLCQKIDSASSPASLDLRISAHPVLTA
ncbi:hypothetical protein AK812_SmicGene16180 [Symbiodinium microadriaticum]|uniref:Uncharacterized protein n=1 Tax=Symbiodinium microadriaticum TaxID=2951 RepID=A0A1Q9E118_SYMMI|nr:hypothetical protein AK812_SmicGene16180 [Symbiodinium microadriaticum]CAE7273725.1 unnamed protein product [Symbiodinium microadriaticum]